MVLDIEQTLIVNYTVLYTHVWDHYTIRITYMYRIKICTMYGITKRTCMESQYVHVWNHITYMYGITIRTCMESHYVHVWNRYTYKYGITIRTIVHVWNNLMGIMPDYYFYIN